MYYISVWDRRISNISVIMKKLLILLLSATLFMGCGGNKSSQHEVSETSINDNGADQIGRSVDTPKTNTLPEGSLPGIFTVGHSKKIHFSKGNLQYKPSKNIWRFAKNQYDIIGNANEAISPDYDGFIDLFSWGTSGWKSSETSMGPADIQSNDATNNWGFGPWGDLEGDDEDDNVNGDWGVFNAIKGGGEKPGLWRTLSYQEWKYLLLKRPRAARLLALGDIGGVTGLFILPDDYYDDDFHSLAQEEYNVYADGYANEYRSYSSWNSKNRSEWETYQNKGVVFLPAAGFRGRTVMYSVGESGLYWTASATSKEWDPMRNNAFRLSFGGSYLTIKTEDKSNGYSVRLVQDAPCEVEDDD